eukprot:2325601-Amphidinium_carterae.1
MPQPTAKARAPEQCATNFVLNAQPKLQAPSGLGVAAASVHTLKQQLPEQRVQQAAAAQSTLTEGLPSLGSVNHGAGCTPCYFFTRKRCNAGEKCRNCHFEHTKLYRPGKRRGEKQRRALRVAADRTSSGSSQDGSAP